MPPCKAVLPVGAVVEAKVKLAPVIATSALVVGSADVNLNEGSKNSQILRLLNWSNDEPSRSIRVL